MWLTFVDADMNTTVIYAEGRDHAAEIFQSSEDRWIGALLAAEDKSYLDSFVRHSSSQNSHPAIPNSTLSDLLEKRRQTRQGTPPSRLGWDVPGYCAEMSCVIQSTLGITRVEGAYMAIDLKTQICPHAWNVLPDLTILDITSDQFMDGSNYRIVKKGHPDWLRYQPEYEYWEDLYEQGANQFSTRFLDHLKGNGERINRTPPLRGLEYLRLEKAGKAKSLAVFSIVEEFLSNAVSAHLGAEWEKQNSFLNDLEP